MANDADDQRPTAAEDDTHANASPQADEASDVSDDDVTVVGNAAALPTDEFPTGLSPRELALTLKGQLLGHFHLQEFIGGGGMGAVFKALDTTLDRIVAVKVVASQSISTEDLQRRFLVEAQSTARLDHPNIARIHYVGRDRGLPYIVFEYIDGVNLRDLVLNHGPIPLGDALSYTCQIAHALAHAWQKEVVHRDIKPSNILVTREGQAKLVDMGLARLHHVDTVDDELTNTGVTLGTFDYISPEQARDPREADIRSDIYSLGCTLFYMLIGRPPFAEGTVVQKLLKHQDQQPPDLSELRADLPESVSRLANSMLAKSPDSRPQTPSEIVEVCQEIFAELGIEQPSSLPPLPAAPSMKRRDSWMTHLPWMVPITGLLLLVLLRTSWQPDGGEQVEFAPLRFPNTAAPAEENNIAAPASEAETSTTSKAEVIESSGDGTNETSPGIEKSVESLDWENYTPPDQISPESSVLEMQTTDPIPSEDTSGENDDEIDLDKIIRS